MVSCQRGGIQGCCLNKMLFENIVGEIAVKSPRTGSVPLALSTRQGRMLGVRRLLA